MYRLPLMVESADRPGVGMVAKPGPALRERLGICQWFHYEDYSSLDRAVDLLRELGIRHLRTGISWADYHRPGAEKWYRHVFSALEEFELLVSVWHTPPSISEGNHCASPSRRLADYADFIDQVITNHGASIAAIELWNEPNNTYKWDFLRYDPHWRKFGEMIGAAAYWAKSRGVTTVLGGMMPVDPHWLALMRGYGVLSYIDVIGIHGFPGMWWGDHPNWDWHHHWRGWEEKITCLAQVAAGLPVWVTEAGLATWDLHEGRQGHMDEQSSRLADLVADVTARSYWYSLIDLDPAREAIEGMHVDENEYHLGLVTHEGLRKPAFHLLKGMLSENKL